MLKRLSLAGTRAGDLATLLDGAIGDGADPADAGSRRAAGHRAIARSETPPDAEDAADDDEADTPAKATAKDRRRAMTQLLAVWRDLARDLVLAERGARQSVRDTALLEELELAARDLPPGAASEFLASIAEADGLVVGNVSPELVLDVLLLRWPRRRRAA